MHTCPYVHLQKKPDGGIIRSSHDEIPFLMQFWYKRVGMKSKAPCEKCIPQLSHFNNTSHCFLLYRTLFLCFPWHCFLFAELLQKWWQQKEGFLILPKDSITLLLLCFFTGTSSIVFKIAWSGNAINLLMSCMIFFDILKAFFTWFEIELRTYLNKKSGPWVLQE